MVKKSEIAEIAWHIYNSVDQAGYDQQIKDLIKSAPVHALKTFIDRCLDDERFDGEPDEDMLIKAKRLTGRLES